MRTTTLGELGAQLPIGRPNGEKLDKGFKLRTFKSRIERHLGVWEESNRNTLDPGQLLSMKVAKLLSMLVEEIGGKAISVAEDGSSTAEGELSVHNWYFSDVMYLYLFARVQSLGPELEHPVACSAGKCDFKTDSAKFDLSTVDVRVADSPKDLSVWVPLKRPFKVRNDIVLNQVKIEPLRWSTMAKPGVLGGSTMTITQESLQDCICAINGDDKEFRLLPTEMDEMEKIDRVRINRFANKVAAGIDLETNLTCPKCGTVISNPLNWTYDYFFDASVPLEI